MARLPRGQVVVCAKGRHRNEIPSKRSCLHIYLMITNEAASEPDMGQLGAARTTNTR
jgi:hypothetical protein